MVNHHHMCNRHNSHAVKMSGNNFTQNKNLILISISLFLLAIIIWSYWSIIVGLLDEWQANDDYSAGQLVPLIALFFVWRERQKLANCVLKPFWWGMALMILAQIARFFGLLFMYESAERYSMLLSIAGLVLTVFGWQMFRHLIWILVFLFLMVPFPGRVHNMISGPLRSIATLGSTFVLEAFIRVSQQGNVLTLNGDTTIGVAEACSGLRMLTAFIIVAAFIAYMVKRSRLIKTILFLSSIPVAIVCNIIRIVVTAVLMLLVSAEAGEKFFHDFAGLVMMPAAVLLIFSVLWLMDKLIVAESVQDG